MQHSKRYKNLKVAVFLLIYSIITVCSKNIKSNLEANWELQTTTDSHVFQSAVVKNDTETILGKNICTPPAIEQFPRPLISPWTRRHGGLIVHILIVAYTFAVLAVVCDEYFVASMTRLCEDLNIAPDVAGATFMAAGSSASELATVIIGVFCAKDDIGISGVIGSAVFNIMFVISVSALATTTACYLNRWPLMRDCVFYTISILVMLYVIFDGYVTWSEALLMLLVYILYCTALYYNHRLERWSQTLCSKIKKDVLGEKSQLVESLDKNDTRTSNGNIRNVTSETTEGIEELEISLQHDCNKSRNYTNDAGFWEKIAWVLVYPIHLVCALTIPDCRLERKKKWYPVTLINSIIWICLGSYIMVWMITIIGTTLGIPDTVMGLTFLAAGVSVPDALASVAVVREGHGDMAVSNAVGSNVFDILICLGIPWFIQTAIVAPGSSVKVTSKGLTYSTVTLLSTVMFVLGAIHINQWKLDKKLGVILMFCYLFFVILALLYELNVFGKLNPPGCPTMY